MDPILRDKAAKKWGTEALKKQVLHESPQRTSSLGIPDVQDHDIYDKNFWDTTLATARLHFSPLYIHFHLRPTA